MTVCHVRMRKIKAHKSSWKGSFAWATKGGHKKHRDHLKDLLICSFNNLYFGNFLIAHTTCKCLNTDQYQFTGPPSLLTALKQGKTWNSALPTLKRDISRGSPGSPRSRAHVHTLLPGSRHRWWHYSTGLYIPGWIWRVNLEQTTFSHNEP